MPRRYCAVDPDIGGTHRIAPSIEYLDARWSLRPDLIEYPDHRRVVRGMKSSTCTLTDRRPTIFPATRRLVTQRDRHEGFEPMKIGEVAGHRMSRKIAPRPSDAVNGVRVRRANRTGQPFE